jgi:hypothetical protein
MSRIVIVVFIYHRDKPIDLRKFNENDVPNVTYTKYQKLL